MMPRLLANQTLLRDVVGPGLWIDAGSPLLPRRQDHPDQNTLIETFLEGKLSEQTRKAYRRDLEDFFRIANTEDVAQVTPDKVIAYRNRVMRFDRPGGELINASTVARKLSSLRSFFEYAHALGFVMRNPASSKLVKTPRVPSEGKTRCLTRAEVRKLFCQPDRTTTKGKRDFALLLLLAHTGLRSSELSNLRVRHLRKERGRMVIAFNGKGQKRRVVPLKKEVWKALEKYWRASGRGFVNSEEPLFAAESNRCRGSFHRPLSRMSIWSIIKGYARKAGIEGVSTHSFRVFAVTDALANGATYQQVRFMTGHADISTVARYDRARDILDNNAVYWISV